MPPSPATPRFTGLTEPYVARVLTYYVLLFAITAVVIRLVPEAGPFLNAALAGAAPSGAGGPLAEIGAAPGSPAPSVLLMPGPAGVALAAVLVMACACLLMLPVAWIYIQTRRRKGFRQSVVQTLIILPLVVAGIAILVKNSVALAFSLGGIVGAISFRNTLRDTKDAIYIFLAIGVGLAAGIQAMGVAAALSVGFNFVVLLLWWTDFGRAPAGLSGPAAERRLRQAKSIENRTSTFVRELDREILKSLTPDQLGAIAERAARRRRQAAAELNDTVVGTAAVPAPAATNASGDVPEDAGNGRPAVDTALRITIRGPVEPARHAVEMLLARETKRWRFRGMALRAGGGTALDYDVRTRKRSSPEHLAAELRARAAAFLSDVSLRAPGTPAPP